MAAREEQMSFGSQKPIWLWLGVMLMMSVSISASAIPNPIAKVGSASKTVIQKTHDGAKAVAQTSGRVVRGVGSTAWHATDSLVNHVRSAF